MERRINIKNRERIVNKKSGVELSSISNSWVFKILTLVVSGVIFFSVYNSILLTVQKLNILKQAEQEVEELRLTNLHLSIGIRDMSTDKYLEKEARDRLNFAGSNEIVFVIPDNALSMVEERVQSITNPVKESVYNTQGNNVYIWIDFLVTGV